MKALLAALALFAAALIGKPVGGVNDAAITADGYPAHLSDYRFFTDLFTSDGDDLSL